MSKLRVDRISSPRKIDETSTSRRSGALLAATATAIAALGPPMSPVLAHAEPGCAQYTTDGEYELQENNGTWVWFRTGGTVFGGTKHLYTAPKAKFSRLVPAAGSRDATSHSTFKRETPTNTGKPSRELSATTA